MNKQSLSALYQDATLALFSSLNIQAAIQELHQVLVEVLPLESLVLHIVDREKMKFRVIADATKEFSEPFKLSEIPEQYRHGPRWQNIDTDTPHLFSGNLANTLTEMLLKKYGYATDTVYWTPLVLDEEHFGEFSALIKAGVKIEESNLEIINMLKPALTIALANALQHEEINQLRVELADDNFRLRNELDEIKGISVLNKLDGLSEVSNSVERVAHLETPVLILGETGVGKEVVANNIHLHSNRSEKPFITVNCGAMPENLADSYLFGHEKGAFTGADQKRKGYFERAHNGTLFLDEVGELSLDVQVRLLRVLETRTIERVGGQDSVPVNVRIIAATHRDLVKMINDGRFREDLWYRLNVFPIVVPPLRHRTGDIPSLVDYFLETKSKELRLTKIPKIGQTELLKLQNYNFPGNVRELQNVIVRALIHSSGTGGEYLSGLMNNISISAAKPAKQSDAGFPNLNDMTRKHIEKALEKCNGRIQGPKGAAKLLAIPPSTLRAKIKKFKINR